MKFLGVGLLLLLAAACNKTGQNNQNNQTGQNQTQNNQQPALQTYHSLTYGFEFQYPQEWGFVTPTYAELQDQIVQLNLPQTAYPKTNFGDAGFAASAQFAKDLPACLALPANTLEGAKFTQDNPKTINGVTFYEKDGTGAGAGNLYETHAFRTFRGNLCLELSETLHTGNIGNYPAGTVTEVNHQEVFSRLDQILNSFKFDQSADSDSTTGMVGVATMGPTCPVQHLGQNCTAPFANGKILVLDSSGKELNSFMTDANGNFKLLIAPGRYNLKLAGGAALPRLEQTAIEVAPDHLTQLNLNLDTGIR